MLPGGISILDASVIRWDSLQSSASVVTVLALQFVMTMFKGHVHRARLGHANCFALIQPDVP